jgi:hypothetical protein
MTNKTNPPLRRGTKAKEKPVPPPFTQDDINKALEEFRRKEKEQGK